jgi:hypothetical protein
MNHEEGNKIIAEFMEIPIRTDYKGIMWDFQKTGKDIYCIRTEQLGYHSSWDWLMPVVKRINDICTEKGTPLSNRSREQEHLPNALDNPLHWKSWSYHRVSLTTEIETVWQSVVNFIKWHNENQTAKA